MGFLGPHSDLNGGSREILENKLNIKIVVAFKNVNVFRLHHFTCLAVTISGPAT